MAFAPHMGDSSTRGFYLQLSCGHWTSYQQKATDVHDEILQCDNV